MGGVRRVRLPAEVVPVFLLDVDAEVLRRLLDVGEGEVAIFVGDTLDLVEAGQGVLDVGSVRPRRAHHLSHGILRLDSSPPRLMLDDGERAQGASGGRAVPPSCPRSRSGDACSYYWQSSKEPQAWHVSTELMTRKAAARLTA